MNYRKITFAAALVLALGLVLTGCMSDGTLGIRTTPTATADFNPSATAGANNATGLNGNDGTGNGVNGTNGVNGVNDVNGAGNNAGTNGNTASTANGALNAFDWANGAADIERAISQISEISESRVVVTNSTALVGVKFDNVYKGELTERIREMVAAEVLKADPSIQTVAVTSDADDVEKVYQLSDQIRSGRTADELSSDINAIVRNATTLR